MLSPKILLVEDNEMNRDMLSRRLKRQGFEVITAEDGIQGLAMAESESPHLILLDMSLPGMDGWEATRRLKSMQQTGSIPIIGLSAHAMNQDRQRALSAGCNEYDTKPVEINRLLEKIRVLLDKGAMAPDSQSVLDKEEALALCSGDEELFLELSAVFLTDAKELIERLKQALESGDFESVEKHAHAVKGISANICAGPLKESAKQLEMAGRNREGSKLASLFKKLHQEFLRIQEYLLKIIPPPVE